MYKAISVTNLTKEFVIDHNRKNIVLKNISISADYGEFISILGVSGSGKSTLLKCISSLMEPTSGEVLINGKNPYKLKNNEVAKLRRRGISFIFQSYNLVESLPVSENIALPLRLSNEKIDISEIEQILQMLGCQIDANAMVQNLSGGEKQKVAIARAILSQSPIIFADEPTGALDGISREVVFEFLKKMAKQGKCVLMVTHDIELASQTDRALILKDGNIFQEIQCPTSNQLLRALQKS
ncbi:TPA: ABC transporter ATP-binding protein [Streptococcus suis]